jgi:hypothetical protein
MGLKPAGWVAERLSSETGMAKFMFFIGGGNKNYF